MTARSNRVAAGLLAVALSGALVACSTSDPLEGDGGTGGGDPTSITIGSQGFAESDILAYVYGLVLEENGYDVDYELGIGSREAFIPALQDGSIDFIPDYSGNLLYGADPDAEATSPEDVAAALPDALESLGLAVLEPAPAEDADALVVTPEFSEENGITSIGDLAKLNGAFTLGANTEFESRPYGRDGLASVYGVEDYTFLPIDDFGGPATLQALLDDQIQVADIYTTTPSIKQNDLVVLDDPENLIAAQNIIPLLNGELDVDALAELLNPVSEALTTEELLELNETAAGDDQPSPEQVARDWLVANGFLEG